MNNKIGIIIGREYWTRVRKKSFLILTLLVPILMTALVMLPLIIGKTSIAKEKIAVVDATGEYMTVLKDTDVYTFVPATKPAKEYRNPEANKKEGITALLEIKGDLLQDPTAWSLSANKQLPPGISDYVSEQVSDYLTKKKRASYNIPQLEEIFAESEISLTVPTYKWSDIGEDQRTSGMFAGFLGLVLTMVIFIFITSYGALVMSGVMEEKKSRILEIMVSSVKPFDLMMGKIIGIGLVGITQIFIWIVFMGLLIMGAGLVGFGGLYNPSDIAGMSPEALSGMAGFNLSVENAGEIQEIASILASINYFELIVFFILYFVGGFMLYASLYAAVGASVSGEEDSNQFVMPVMIVMMMAFYAAFGSAENPEGPLAFWGSMIPFSSPIVMMVRLPYEVPMWQKLLSVAILYATFIGITWLSAKIYRVGILLNGKKTTYADLWKWIRYS